MRNVRALAVTMPLILGVATTALAQQNLQPRPATDPSTLPPLPPPLPPPPGEPSSSPPPADTKVDTTWRAPEPPEPPTPPTPQAHSEEPVRRWYGWQIILTDGAALASLLAIQNGDGWGDLALTLYLGGGPVVHFAHGNVAKGAGSLALRVLAPLGGALIGGLVGAMVGGNGSGCGTWFCPSPALVGAGVGVLAGLLGAPIVDVAVLAYDIEPVGSHASEKWVLATSSCSSESLRLHLVPVAALPRDSTGHVAPTFGLVGSF